MELTSRKVLFRSGVVTSEIMCVGSVCLSVLLQSLADPEKKLAPFHLPLVLRERSSGEASAKQTPFPIISRAVFSRPVTNAQPDVQGF